MTKSSGIFCNCGERCLFKTSEDEFSATSEDSVSSSSIINLLDVIVEMGLVKTGNLFSTSCTGCCTHCELLVWDCSLVSLDNEVGVPGTKKN